MKRSEIELGGEYAATRRQDWRSNPWSVDRVRVVDLGPFRETSRWTRIDLGEIDGTPTTEARYRRAREGDATDIRHSRFIAVRQWDPAEEKWGDRIDFRQITSFKVPWPEFERIRDADRQADAAARERQREREAADQTERAELQEIADKVGVTLDFVSAYGRPGSVIISRADLRRLLAAALAEDAT